MQLFGKSDATKEGARMIGDRFYEKGISSYPKALEYYVTGESAVKIEQIAKEYFDKGGDSEIKAAETYLKLKTSEGAKKAGDIYYNRNEFQKAIDAYLSGGVEEGIQKYADYLYADHRNEEADNLIMRLGDAYSEQKNDDAVEKLAARTMNKGSYALAAKLYDKAGNVTMGDKCRAYDALIGFRLEEAKGLFTTSNDLGMVKMISDNQKALTPLADLAQNMEDLMKNSPPVNLITDSITGKSVPSTSDQKMQEDYYKSIREQIIKNVSDIALHYAKLTDPNLKKFVRQRFLTYGAVRNILDKDTFIAKKQKTEIKVKDVIL
jgi:tetratricopeptide (TPR) repeat protein